MNLDITRAEAEDMDELCRLYDELCDYLAAHVNYPGWQKGIYPTRQDAGHFLESEALYVARLGDKIVGSAAFSHEPEAEPVRGAWLIDESYDRVFVIHTLAVHPGCLHQGVGKALLEFGEELARAQGVTSIRLDVYEKNLPAIRAYEKQGYRFIDKVDLGFGQYGLDWFYLYEKLI